VSISKRLLSLLERWAERENIRMNGRALILPEFTHRWAFNKIGGLEIISSGVCWERCTATYVSTDLDEFGAAFRELEEIEQALILIDHLGSPREWQEAVEFYEALKQRSFESASRQANRTLRQGWMKLTLNCLRRGLVKWEEHIPE
jgi:hypothetical protein